MVESSPSESVIVGQVLGTHGVSGGIRAKTLSDVPHRFNPGEVVYIHGQPHRIIASTRTSPDQLILRFHDLDAPEAARPLVGAWITVPPEAVPPLPQGEYFHFQILGLSVLTPEGESLGQVSEILETGSNDVYVVSGGGRELLVPALAQIIRQVDLTQGVMIVDLPQGLR